MPIQATPAIRQFGFNFLTTTAWNPVTKLRQAAVGLGATDFQTVSRVVLPAALPAIIIGTTRALARAAGETAPLLFTALFTQFGEPTEKGGRIGYLVEYDKTELIFQSPQQEATQQYLTSSLG